MQFASILRNGNSVPIWCKHTIASNMVLPSGLDCRFFRVYLGDCLDDKRSAYSVLFVCQLIRCPNFSLCPLPTKKVACNPAYISPCDRIRRSHYWGWSDLIKAPFRAIGHCQPSTQFIRIFWVCIRQIFQLGLLNNLLKNLWTFGPMPCTWSYSLKIYG